MLEATRPWTLEELHRLPDDGNKYELVRGELFVTPPPSTGHEDVLARLTRILDPYVAEHRLGYVFHPRSVIQSDGSEVEPDLMVRAPMPSGTTEWRNAPIPILVVEVLSGSTRRRDLGAKRELYLDAGVTEYWVIDRERRTVRVITKGAADRVIDNELIWTPSQPRSPLQFSVERLFIDE